MYRSWTRSAGLRWLATFSKHRKDRGRDAKRRCTAQKSWPVEKETKRLRIKKYRLRTLSNGSRSDEGALDHHAGSLLFRDTGDRGALQWLVELSQKLIAYHTEALSVCENMVTDVVVSIGCEDVVGEVALSQFALG
jgi:hypothetical protein